MPSGMKWNFLRENEVQLLSQSMLSKLQRGECNDFWKEIKALKPKKGSLPVTVEGTSGESNIANLWKDHFSAIVNSVGSMTTEIGSWMHWGLSNAITMLLMYMSWGKLGKDWKIIIKLLAMMGFHLKSISLHLSDCWPWCQYSFPVVYWLVSYRIPLCM